MFLISNKSTVDARIAKSSNTIEVYVYDFLYLPKQLIEENEFFWTQSNKKNMHALSQTMVPLSISR